MALTRVLSVFKSRRNDLDMTEGNIAGKILQFALPLMAGSLFQQLYNLVDTWVIGQTGIDGAYAAVGTMGPVINILIGFFLGLASGAGVIISQQFGAGNEERVRKTVHTALTMTLIMAALFTVIGLLMTPTLLNFMLHNEDGGSTVYPHAKTYLTIYCAGVAGVALATVIAQAVSATLVVIALLRAKNCVKLTLRNLGIDGIQLRQIIRVGIPAALQMALTSFANVFVQSYVAGINVVAPDGFTAAEAQAHCLGGWTSYSKIDMLLFLPVQALALAVTTFVGQNLGAGRIDRAKRGTKLAFLMALLAAASLIVVVEIFAHPIASLINKDVYILEYAVLFLRWISPFYLLCCVNQIFSAALRGAGNTRAPMIIMLTTFVGVRQIYLYVMSNFISNDPLPIAFGYPVGWLACAITTLVYYFCIFRYENSKRLTNQ